MSGIHTVPRKIMLLRCQIAAFVEIPSNFPGGTEIREEQLQQLEREFICHIPTGSRSFAARVQRLPAARKQEPHPINSPGSEAKVEERFGFSSIFKYRASHSAALRKNSRQLS